MNPGRGRASEPFYRAEIPPEIADVVRGLPPEVKRHVKQALVRLVENPASGKQLTGELSGLRSYKARRLRIVYRLNESEQRLLILHIGHRRTVYEKLTREIRRQFPSP